MRAAVRLLFLLMNISALAGTIWAAMIDWLDHGGRQIRQPHTRFAGI
jgi:hypothetical protein